MKGTTIFCVLLVLHITTGFGQPPPWELADLWAPGPWTPWSACSTSCGLGTRQRTRACRDFYTYQPTCPDEFKLHSKYVWKQTVKCKKRSCPVDGGWAEWAEWSECSQNCREGASKGEIRDNQPHRKRYKHCTNPRAAFGGKKCAKQEGINIKYDSNTGGLVEKGDCESDLPLCPDYYVDDEPAIKRGDERRR